MFKIGWINFQKSDQQTLGRWKIKQMITFYSMSFKMGKRFTIFANDSWKKIIKNLLIIKMDNKVIGYKINECSRG